MAGEKTLSEEIYEVLYKDITSQKLKCGQNITLNELRMRFNVSQTPIREALQRLVSDGLLEYYSNKGVKVVDFSEDEIRQIFEFSAELEATAVLFCGNSFLKAPMLDELRLCIENEAEALKGHNSSDWDRNAGRIHDVIYKYCGNKYLKEAADRMGSRMDLLTTFYDKKDACEAIHKRHVGVYEAVKNDDFKRAAVLVKEHLQYSMVEAMKEYTTRRTENNK